MIITLTGDNSFALRSRLDELIAVFAKEHGDLALERIDCEEVQASEILAALQSLPFLAARKMVILQGLGSNKAIAEEIEQIIDSVSESTDLIIIEPSPDKRGKYFKNLQKKTKIEDYKELDARQLAEWIVEKTKELAGSISLADASYLVDRAGASQQALASELSKLVLYRPQISKDTVDLLVEPNPQSKVFELLDAAFSGNKQSVIGLYNQQRSQRVEPQVILAMIAWQLRALTAAKMGQDKAASKIAKDFGINPYVISKSVRLAGKISLSQLKNLLEEALEMDYKSKTATYDLDEALKNYLVTIA